MNTWQDGNLLVVSHDAGGAEVVSSWVRACRDPLQTSFVLEGPAQRIFERKIPGLRLLSRQEAFAAISGFDRVLTGSGWGSDLEKQAMLTALAAAIPVAVYLDHWTNYLQRFPDADGPVLPNEIWVGDEHAYRLAKKVIPKANIRLEANRYLSEAVDAVLQEASAKAPESSRETIRVLYLCEPRSMNYGQADYWGYTEYEALEGALRWLSEQTQKIQEVRVRLHPSERHGKYAESMERFADRFDLEESGDRNLTEDVAWADWVIGCDSMAMVVALRAGRQVFSCIPPGGRPMTLPFEEIRRLFL